MSGLNQRFTKPSFLNWDREFESRSLRQQYLVSVVCGDLYFDIFFSVKKFLKSPMEQFLQIKNRINTHIYDTAVF